MSAAMDIPYKFLSMSSITHVQCFIGTLLLPVVESTPLCNGGSTI